MPTTPAHVACFTGLYAANGTIQPNADALANLVPGPGGAAGPVTATSYKLDPAAITTDASTARTLTPNDDGTYIYFTNNNPITVTMFAANKGFSCVVMQGGNGNVTFAAGGTMMAIAGGLTKTSSQGAMATIIAPANSTILISGTLA